MNCFSSDDKLEKLSYQAFQAAEMSSKVTFRARMVDSARPLSIFKAEELPDITDVNNMGRLVEGSVYKLRDI